MVLDLEPRGMEEWQQSELVLGENDIHEETSIAMSIVANSEFVCTFHAMLGTGIS